MINNLNELKDLSKQGEENKKEKIKRRDIAAKIRISRLQTKTTLWQLDEENNLIVDFKNTEYLNNIKYWKENIDKKG